MNEDEDAKLDELLFRVVPSLAEEDERALGAEAEDEEFPAAVRASILARAESLSSELLAAAILESGEAAGKPVDVLVAECGEDEGDVRAVLAGARDPRKLGKAGFARLLASAEADARELRELIAQAVAQFVLVYAQPKRGVAGVLRALGASRQASAAGSDRRNRNPSRGRAVGSGFADDVVAEWANLTGAKD